MNLSFYPKLAWSGIRKNGRLYIPYILTCIGMVMMYYIISALTLSDVLDRVKGGGTAQSILGLGQLIVALFSLLFLFYSNSFLIRRRTKEFGMYNILGMGKWHIGGVLLAETLLTGSISLVFGLAGGIALFKFAELGLVNAIRGEISYALTVSWDTVKQTAILFSVIFFLIFLNSLFRIHISNPVALLRGENVGEKPPKANWLFGLGGAVLLGWAYYVAVIIEQPIEALVWFFVAVAAVIVATYLLFIAGSVLLCRILQKSKGYYYRKNHFVSVSSMAYRMKRNGAGLASICILSTMVLVMIAGSACLYFGAEDVIFRRYPYDISTEVCFDNGPGTDEEIAGLKSEVDTILAFHDAEQTTVQTYRAANVTGLLTDGVVNPDSNVIVEVNIGTYNAVHNFYFIPLEDYNRLTGENASLGEREVMIAGNRGAYPARTLTLYGGETFSVIREVEPFVKNGDTMAELISTFYVVVPDMEEFTMPFVGLVDDYGNARLRYVWYYDFDLDVDAETEILLEDQIWTRLRDMDVEHNYDFLYYYHCYSRAANWEDFFATFGGLFYLGILLSIVFLTAAVLIIYYKQIAEGYEDQSRFEIMQKIGMTKRDIRKSINSQMLTVFFMPLFTAVLHLAFAFPMIRKLLMFFNMNNLQLLLAVTAISVLIFGVFYVFVYRITSNAYYAIVSGAKKE